MIDIDNYSKNFIHFYDIITPSTMLLDTLKRKRSEKENYSIIDIGCGDGVLLYTMIKMGLLNDCNNVTGVDLSKIRIERINRYLPHVKGIVSDACCILEIKDRSFDVAISSQVIEHVPDDKRMLREIGRILEPNGLLYISSVIKKRYGIYLYYDKGFRLDPTHIREYPSIDDFLNLLNAENFEIISYNVSKVQFPYIDLLIRGLGKAGLISLSNDIFLKHESLKKSRRFKLTIPGYYFIEVSCKIK